MREKCRDPCPGSCGSNAHCQVFNHIPMCTCPEGYTGDPFLSCYVKPERKHFINKKLNIHYYVSIMFYILKYNYIIFHYSTHSTSNRSL